MLVFCFSCNWLLFNEIWNIKSFILKQDSWSLYSWSPYYSVNAKFMQIRLKVNVILPYVDASININVRDMYLLYCAALQCNLEQKKLYSKVEILGLIFLYSRCPSYSMSNLCKLGQNSIRFALLGHCCSSI